MRRRNSSLEHVADLVCGHPHQLAGPALTDVARVGAVEVVGDPAADPVELDAEDDLVAVGQGLALAERQVLGREHLQLQRQVRTPAVAKVERFCGSQPIRLRRSGANFRCDGVRRQVRTRRSPQSQGFRGFSADPVRT
jgi:hypothetical protein